MAITPHLAQKLILQQFPELAHLPITPVKYQGHDNRTFHLGDDKLLRFPTDSIYALAVAKEQKFLPFLQRFLTVKIPEPLFLGTATKDYPFPFSIYKWIPGENPQNFDDHQLESLALDLSHFLKELQKIGSSTGPTPGVHNWHRGDSIKVYDKNFHEQITQLPPSIDRQKLLNIWEQALQTYWQEKPVWIHGDFSSTNILVHEKKLVGIIDFGCMAVGDPACDLVIAWTFLKNDARKIFVQQMNLDSNTWLRAKAWALWKASFEWCQTNNLMQLKLIEELLL